MQYKQVYIQLLPPKYLVKSPTFLAITIKDIKFIYIYIQGNLRGILNDMYIDLIRVGPLLMYAFQPYAHMTLSKHKEIRASQLVLNRVQISQSCLLNQCLMIQLVHKVINYFRFSLHMDKILSECFSYMRWRTKAKMIIKPWGFDSIDLSICFLFQMRYLKYWFGISHFYGMIHVLID